MREHTELSNTTASTTNLMKMIYDRLNQSKPRQKVGAIFIDLQKAFNTVSHTLFLQKVNEMGIKGTFYEILKSFLTNGHQFVELGDERSEKIH